MVVRIGLMGSGFIGDRYLLALEDVRGAEVTANFSNDLAKAKRFAEKHSLKGRSYDDMEDLAADPDVDLVVIGLPNEVHLDAVRAVAAAGKGVVCTKPLGRTAAEANEILRIVQDAGVWHGYAENSAFAPNLVRVFEMVEAGAIGTPVRMRAVEGHSGPHAPHFWDAERAGGGALLDMGCHMIEVSRILFGKRNPITEVMAFGATYVHADKTTGEDVGLAMLKFRDGQIATIECSWIERGGMQLRHEITGSNGRLITDTMGTSVWGFVEQPGGYLVEKADTDTGWVFPVPEEARAYGFSQEMRHFVEAFAKGVPARENFEDGAIVNAVIDACYASMRSRAWEPVPA